LSYKSESIRTYLLTQDSSIKYVKILSESQLSANHYEYSFNQ
jgi:hypothetical protein